MELGRKTPIKIIDMVKAKASEHVVQRRAIRKVIKSTTKFGGLWHLLECGDEVKDTGISFKKMPRTLECKVCAGKGGNGGK